MNDADLRADEDLVAYLDGALDDPVVVEAVRVRLAADPAYALRARELQALDELLGLHPEAPAPATLADAIVDAARAEAAREAFRRKLVRGVAAAAVVAAVGIGGALMSGDTRAPNDGERSTAETITVADLEPYARLAPVEDAPDDLAEVEARLALLERVQSDFFSG